MSNKDFNLETVYHKIQGLKDLKTKLSLRTFTNEDFYKNLNQNDINNSSKSDDDSSASMGDDNTDNINEETENQVSIVPSV